jgi:hypothetical protein
VADAQFLTPPEQANLIAAQAVAAATSFLDGRSSPLVLVREASRIHVELEKIASDPKSHKMIDVSKMFVTMMVNCGISSGSRADRWAEAMSSFIPLLRFESHDLASTGAQRQ